MPRGRTAVKNNGGAGRFLGAEKEEERADLLIYCVRGDVLNVGVLGLDAIE